MKDVKQQALAVALGISRPGWQKQEATGQINEEHWPAIEKETGMNKEQIEALTQERIDAFLAGQPFVSNKNEGANSN